MRITAHKGDITTEHVDAVVNAANPTLMGGGGVDGALHRAAGPELLDECRAVRAKTWVDGLPVGEAVATGAGELPARWVIHTVGPNRHCGQTDPTLLASCFRRSLEVAAQVGARSVAFPAISAGIYGWDAVQVADVAVVTVREYAGAQAEGDGDVGGGGGTAEDGTGGGRDEGDRDGDAGIQEVRFVLFSDQILAEFERALGEH